MLKKINRIQKRGEFEEIKAKGMMYPAPLFGVLVVKSDEGKKFGFIISKRISKRAVDRNKIKRRLAEAIQTNMDSLGGDYKMVFLAKKVLLTSSMEEINKEVKYWLINIGEKDSSKTAAGI